MPDRINPKDEELSRLQKREDAAMEPHITEPIWPGKIFQSDVPVDGTGAPSTLTEYQRGILPEKPISLGDLIEPMPGKIAVQIETKKEWTPAGLFIPIDTARTVHESRATQGRVVAIGGDDDDDLASAPSRVSIGDTVIFGKYTGTKISWHPGGDRTKDKEELVIMYEKDLLAILRSPEEARHIKVRT